MTIYTENLCIGGTATAIAAESGWEASYAFNGQTNSPYWYYYLADTPLPGWIQYQFTEAQRIRRLRIYSYSDAGVEAIKDFELFGSNTGSFSGEEISIYSGTHTNETTQDFITYDFNDNNNEYLYYRIIVTSTYTRYGGNYTVGIQEIEMMDNDFTLDFNPNRPDTITELYHQKHTALRGRAKAGYIRPTIKQFFTSSDWVPIELPSGQWTFDNITNPTQSLSLGDWTTGGMGIFVTPNEDRLIFACNNGTYAQQFIQLNLGTPGDLTTASFGGNYSPSPQTYTHDIFLDSTGTKLYSVEYGTGKVYQYGLGTAWDITSTSLVNTLDMTSGPATFTGYPEGIHFNNDLSYMYISHHARIIGQFELSTPGDITTASKISQYDTTGAYYIWSVRFSTDGSKMFIVKVINFNDGNTPNYYDERLHILTLSTPWDITSAQFTAEYIPENFIGAGADALNGMAFNNDGSNMYISSARNGMLYKYQLTE